MSKNKNVLNKKMLELPIYHNDIDEAETVSILIDVNTRMSSGGNNLPEIVNLYCDFIIGKTYLKISTNNADLGGDGYEYSEWKDTILEIASTIDVQKCKSIHHYVETIGKVFKMVYPNHFYLYYAVNDFAKGKDEATNSTNFVIDTINRCFSDFPSIVIDKCLDALDAFFGDTRMFHPVGKQLMYDINYSSKSSLLPKNIDMVKDLFLNRYSTIFDLYLISRHASIFDQLAAVCIDDFQFYLFVPYDDRFEINFSKLFENMIDKMDEIIK